jgi:hypothetical protein
MIGEEDRIYTDRFCGGCQLLVVGQLEDLSAGRIRMTPGQPMIAWRIVEKRR